MWPEIAILIAINIWIAWRYAHQTIGPDEGNWMLWGWTGARPYKDFQDCKPPGIHAWMWLLAHLTGRRIVWAKFIHHAAIGGLVALSAGVSGSLGSGLLATALLQSARLFAFQSWMDALSGALLLCGMTLPPMIGIWFIGAATCFNIKAAVPGAVYMALTGAWLPLLIGAGSGFLILALYRVFFPLPFDRMWFNVFTITARMKAERRWQMWGMYQMVASMLMVMFVGVVLAAGMSFPVGMAALAYCLFNAWGKVWRPNHYLPLALMVAHARPDPAMAALVLLADAVSANLYLGNVWMAVYPSIAYDLAGSREVGQGLRDKEGSLWVDTFHTQIYVYAQKKPQTGMVEQLEIRDVTPEIRTRRDAALRKTPPQWVVIGPGAIENWEPRGYQAAANIGNFHVMR